MGNLPKTLRQQHVKKCFHYKKTGSKFCSHLFLMRQKRIRAGAFLQPCKTSKMEVFGKIVNGFQPQWFYRVVNMPEKTSHWLSLYSLPKKCPYSELFWSAFSRIRTEYEQIRSNENADQNNSKYEHFPRSDKLMHIKVLWKNSPRFLLL